MPTDRENFLDVAFDVLPVDRLLSRIAETRSGAPFRYLVTPNVDHMVRLHKRSAQIDGLEEAYRRADLCICDSKVLGLLARWRGVHLPVLPGSDLTALMFDRAGRNSNPAKMRGQNVKKISATSLKRGGAIPPPGVTFPS